MPTHSRWLLLASHCKLKPGLTNFALGENYLWVGPSEKLCFSFELLRSGLSVHKMPCVPSKIQPFQSLPCSQIWSTYLRACKQDGAGEFTFLENQVQRKELLSWKNKEKSWDRPSKHSDFSKTQMTCLGIILLFLFSRISQAFYFVVKENTRSQCFWQQWRRQFDRKGISCLGDG